MGAKTPVHREASPRGRGLVAGELTAAAHVSSHLYMQYCVDGKAKTTGYEEEKNFYREAQEEN